MGNQSLYAPWRIEYIRSLNSSGELAAGPGGCFLCQASQAATPDEQRRALVLWRTEHSVVVMNRYPYTNGHLLIAPRAHKAQLEQLDDAEQLDLTKQTIAAISLLSRATSPQGFNVGINLGRCAGAGLPGHVHQHLVPRWGGDTNFMSVIGDIRIVPQATLQLYDELIKVRG